METLATAWDDRAGVPAAAALEEMLAASGCAELDSAEFAAKLDEVDPLREFRSRFAIPQHEGEDGVYLCGNSLGLMPHKTREVIQGQLDKWCRVGVKGHFEEPLPWARCEEALPALMAEVVGCSPDCVETEVACANSLSVNLHMLMAAFYRPTAERNLIMIEAAAFPSDRYAVTSQIVHHGFDPATSLLEVKSPDTADLMDGGIIPTQTIIDSITANKDRLSLVLFSGLQYLSGQAFDVERVTAHVHTLNAAAPAGTPPIIIGWDCAHAAGNVEMKLHDWNVDFAAWCSYKYLNSGAGCLSGFFVHERHATEFEKHPRLAGWWGVKFEKRFKMEHQVSLRPHSATRRSHSPFVLFTRVLTPPLARRAPPQMDLTPGAAGFICSNQPPMLVACMMAPLQILQEAGGVRATRRKSVLLTGYLELLLQTRGLTAPADGARGVEIVTPSDPTARGCQVSVLFNRYITRESCSQFDSLPLTSLTIERAAASSPSESYRSERRAPLSLR
jgi:kynureninase